MSSLQPGSFWFRVQPPARVFLVVSAAILCLSCSTVQFQSQPSWHGQSAGSRSQFNQSCGAACAAPVNPGTGEILAPAVPQAGQVLENVVRAAEAIQGFITVSRFLDEAQKEAVESILVDCVRQANTKVDEELFGKDRMLPDSECEKEPLVEEKLGPTWARHLGERKHAVAFECIQMRLAERFPDNFSIEPRLRKDPFTQDVVLTDWRKGSLKPDVVIHFTRNVTRIQCIFELKFPCGYEVANPWTSHVDAQMKLYQELGGECPPVLVSPQRGLQRTR